MTEVQNTNAAAFEANKPHSTAPSYLLTLLAACSNSIPVTGVEGEATLSEQLSALLKGKQMLLLELNMLYNYRFGFSINEALKFAGFKGDLEAFLHAQKCFSMRDGYISLKPVVAVESHQDAPGDQAVPEECVLATSLEDCAKVIEDAETASNAETESPCDAEIDSDHDSDVDVPSWHAVGKRLVAALGSREQYLVEPDEEGGRQEGLGDHLAERLHAEEFGDGEDIAAWYDVSNRFLTAFKSEQSDDSSLDHSPDATEWPSVGSRVLRTYNDEETDIDACKWHSVGSRVLSHLNCLEA